MMVTNTQQGSIAPNHAFFVFVFSTTGWAMLESALAGIRAGFAAHGLASLAYACAGVLVLRRRGFMPGASSAAARASASPMPRLAPSDTRCTVVLFVLGYALGATIVAGSALLLAGAGIALLVLPWVRPSFFEAHFLAAGAAFLAATMLAAATGILHAPAIERFLAAWVLWGCALFGLFLPARQVSPGKPKPGAAPGAREPG